DTSQVTDMANMFYEATSFNGDISGWDTSKVTTVNSMLYGASSFNRSLGQWDVSSVQNIGSIFRNAGLSIENYDATLAGWAAQDVHSDMTLDASGLAYCSATPSRQSLINNYGWTITGDSQCPLPGTPTDVKGTPGVSSLQIDWTRPADPLATI